MDNFNKFFNSIILEVSYQNALASTSQSGLMSKSSRYSYKNRDSRTQNDQTDVGSTPRKDGTTYRKSQNMVPEYRNITDPIDKIVHNFKINNRSYQVIDDNMAEKIGHRFNYQELPKENERKKLGKTGINLTKVKDQYFLTV